MNTLSLVIPAYNEESRIGETIDTYHKYLSERGSEFEIIVVCDGCSDSTPRIVEDFAQSHSGIRLLEYPARLGKGGGVLDGMKHARLDIVGFVDADNAVPPLEFDKLLVVLEDSDGAIASRRMEGARILVPRTLVRELLSKGFNVFVRMLFGLRFQDTQCGGKVFRREAIEKVLKNLDTRGFEFDVELLWKLERDGHSIAEVPINWEHKGQSQFRLSFITEMFMSLIRLRLGI